MVVFDDEANGYRHHILPVAHREPLVQKAVCIASAFHLSGQRPHLRGPAEVVRASLIRKLSETSVVNPDLSETTWATIVLLIVADLVIGHEDVETLYGLLAAFLEARGPLKESATQLERFLYFQSCIIGFFTRPFSALEARPIRSPQVSGDPVAMFKQYVRGLENCKKPKSPSQRKGYDFSSYFPLYEESFRLAGEIYTTRAELETLTANLEYYMEDRVQQIRTICEQIDPTVPGSHVVVWPMFVAGAESVSEEHRQYFSTALRKIYGMTGYANILRGFTVLPELWEQRGIFSYRLKPSWLLALLSTRTVLAAHAIPPAHPMITPAPDLSNRAIERRLDVGGYVNSLIDSLGSDVSSYVASGVPQFFQDFPSGEAVVSSLGIHNSDLDAKPTQVLNIPAYANWTEDGWNVRVHGNVYKQPNISEEKLNDLADVFLIDTDIDELSIPEQRQARNLTASIFVVQQGDMNVTIDFVNDVDVRPDASGGVVNAEGGAQSIDLPYKTTAEGDFDTFVILQNTTGPNNGHLIAGNATSSIQALNMYARGTDTGNATAYLVPPEGFTIVSDIDDILRVTKIYDPKEGLLNSFAREFTPWMNMPEIYANWSATIPNFHFHYLTTTPEQATRNYMEFIYKTYPLGSFDTRPLNFSDVSATLSIRRALLDKIFQTFPRRRFVLVADTSNADVMRDYPRLARDYPGQVQCIFLRNTSATDSSDLFPYDTAGFEGLDQSRYMFFVTPDDLRGVDIVAGNCHNRAVVQNVTFGYQWRGLGSGEEENDDEESGAESLAGPWKGAWGWVLVVAALFVTV
ncbi:hypothetical protein F4811DRAFT_568391 [Daldinia bambusicola]|nr:hypothetical protein F4811DRAFT_568391 [Daldinia bambusicola]